jgi:hypothetical protein
MNEAHHRRACVSTHIERGSAEATAAGLRKHGLEAVVVPLDDVSDIGRDQLDGEMLWMVVVRQADLSRARAIEEELRRNNRVRKLPDGSFELSE